MRVASEEFGGAVGVGALDVADQLEFTALNGEFAVDTISRIFIASTCATQVDVGRLRAQDTPRPRVERYSPESPAVRRQTKA